MDLTFKLGDVVIILAVILGAGVLGYLVLILARVAATVKNINAVLETNKTNIDETMKSLPGILDNVNQITGIVRQKTELVDSFLSNPGHDTEGNESSSLIETLQTAISSITSIIGIFNEIKDFFSPKKRILKFRKKK